MFEVMKEKKIRPTKQTILAVFQCISELGDIEGLYKYLKELKVLKNNLADDKLRNKSLKLIPDDE